jgi:hypothetical protein
VVSNRDYVEHAQGLRRGNAAQPHRNKTRYSRKVKHTKRDREQ